MLAAGISSLNSLEFSIIIPTLNAASTIGDAMESIHSQTYNNYEVLILDGGSSDNTLDIVANFKDKNNRFRCIVEKDSGIYDAMNKGVKKARGKWLFFLGSDDYFYSPDVLAIVHEKIIQNQKAEMVYGNVWLSKPLPHNTDTCLYGAKYSAEKLLQRNICHQCIFYQRRLFKRFGLYRTRYIIFADWDFNLKIFNKINSLYIDNVIAYYNVDGLSGKSHQLDGFFGKDFLENMATQYSYNYKDTYFNNRKKELVDILQKQIRSYKFIAAAKISLILTYQVLIPPFKKVNKSFANV